MLWTGGKRTTAFAVVLPDIALCKAWQLILLVKGVYLLMCHQNATNYLPGMYHKLFSGSCKQKGAKAFYMWQVFKLVGSLERKKKENTEREGKRESLWKQSFHSTNGVSQTDTVTTCKAGIKNPEGKSLCYDGKPQPEEKTALKLELAYP